MCPDWSMSFVVKLGDQIDDWSNIFGFKQSGTKTYMVGYRIPALFVRNHDAKEVVLGFRTQLGDNWDYGTEEGTNFRVSKNEWHEIQIQQKHGVYSIIINGKTVHQKKNNNPTLFDNVSGDFCSYGYAYNCAVGEYRDFKTEFGDCAKGKLVRFLQLSKLVLIEIVSRSYCQRGFCHRG